MLDDDGAVEGLRIEVAAEHRGVHEGHPGVPRTERPRELGDAEAGSRVARPGHSEHQLGTTIDVTSEGDQDVDQSWGTTPAGQWVATNAHEYGFLLSYPPDASDRTCYDYEPWHLRYVGRELASDVIESGLSLREYLWQLNPVDITATTTTASTATTAAG